MHWPKQIESLTSIRGNSPNCEWDWGRNLMSTEVDDEKQQRRFFRICSPFLFVSVMILKMRPSKRFFSCCFTFFLLFARWWFLVRCFTAIRLYFPYVVFVYDCWTKTRYTAFFLFEGRWNLWSCACYMAYSEKSKFLWQMGIRILFNNIQIINYQLNKAHTHTQTQLTEWRQRKQNYKRTS